MKRLLKIERHVGVRVLVGEGEELGREQRAVIVIEDAVEDEHAPPALAGRHSRTLTQASASTPKTSSATRP